MRRPLLGLTLVVVSMGCSSGPAARDVTAARACEVATEYVGAVTSHRQPPPGADQALAAARDSLSEAARALQRGDAGARYTGLGADMMQWMRDATTQDAAAIQQDGLKVAGDCGKIPSRARQAGGYFR